MKKTRAKRGGVGSWRGLNRANKKKTYATLGNAGKERINKLEKTQWGCTRGMVFASRNESENTWARK